MKNHNKLNNSFLAKMSLCLLSVLLISTTCFAATYYLDSQAGNDNNSGTSALAPIKTLERLSNMQLNPGDNILFKRNGVYSGSIYISTSDITISDYGESGDLPIITNAKILNGWFASGTNKYSVSCPLPEMVIFSNQVGLKVSSLDNVNSNTKWYWNNNVLTVYSDNSPLNDNKIISAAFHNYTQPNNADWVMADSYIYYIQIEPAEMVFNNDTACQEVGSMDQFSKFNQFFYDWSNQALFITSQYAPSNVRIYHHQSSIRLERVSNIHIKNISFKYNATGMTGVICMHGTNNCTIENLIMDNNSGGVAIHMLPDLYTLNVSGGNIIKNCQIYNMKYGTVSYVSNNFGSGITISGPKGSEIPLTKYNEIKNNLVYNCLMNGISIYESPENIVSYNTTHHCGWSGIGIAGETNANKNIVEHNNVYENCQLRDDCAGIYLCRAGYDNIIRYNIVHDQHDTLNDPSIPINDGYTYKFGTDAIRFDGGDFIGKQLGLGGDYMDMPNKAYYNLIYNEDNGMQIFNWSNVEIYNNTIVNSKRNGMCLHAYNTVNNQNPEIGTELLTGLKVKNNIIYNAGNSVIYSSKISSTGNEIEYNAYYPEKYNQDINSHLIEPVSYYIKNTTESDKEDFVLLAEGSPLINAGLNVGITADILGSAVNNPPDIGAYEYTQTTVINEYNVNISSVGEGSVSPEIGSYAYEENTSLQLSASSATGYHFDKWTINSQDLYENPLTLIINEEKTIIANFEQDIVYYTLNTSALPLSAGNVNISPFMDQYEENSIVTLTAQPQTGYHFKGWDADASGGSNPIYITMDNNKLITAVFEINTYTISATSQSTGSISPSGTIMVNYNTSKQFTITPNSGYVVSDVIVDGASKGAVTTYTFNNIKANHSIEARFKAKTTSKGCW